MRDAVEVDRECNQKGKPAISRLRLAGEVFAQLKKTRVQEHFFEIKGCQILADWL